jgi:hypothetical protein
MSRKSELRADLERVGMKIGGACLTREAREVTFKAFAQAMRDKNFGIRSAQQIGGRHLEAFAAARKEAGIGARTLQNQMSHIRAVLIAIGKTSLAKHPNYSNKALGIGKGSRIGTKKAMPDKTVQATVTRSEQLGRPGLGAALVLQRTLGLRAAEAVRAGNPKTLARLERELTAKGCVRIVEGTKGGRPRDVYPADRERALAAIRDARAILRESGQSHLITRADGSPAKDLKQAMSIYRNVFSREGVQSHAARYAFAAERVKGYGTDGYERREALAATSLDLGHGDGRARYVSSVYARED